MSMTYEHILVEREEGVGIVTLNRPDVLNAMNRKLGRASRRRQALEADDGVGCLVITGAGDKAFSAGGDIREQVEDDKRYSREEQEKLGNPRRALEIASCAKPVIGMINGLAYGGAAVLASAVDIRIGCEKTRVPVPRRGLRADQRHLVARQPDRLAAGQGAAVHRPHRRGRGGLSHRPPQSPRPQVPAAHQDDGDREHDRGQPSRRRKGVKALLLEQQAESLAGRWEAESATPPRSCATPRRRMPSPSSWPARESRRAERGCATCPLDDLLAELLHAIEAFVQRGRPEVEHQLVDASFWKVAMSSSAASTPPETAAAPRPSGHAAVVDRRLVADLQLPEVAALGLIMPAILSSFWRISSGGKGEAAVAPTGCQPSPTAPRGAAPAPNGRRSRSAGPDSDRLGLAPHFLEVVEAAAVAHRLAGPSFLRWRRTHPSRRRGA